MKTPTPSPDSSKIKAGKTEEMKREDEKMGSGAGRRLFEKPDPREMNGKLRITITKLAS